MTDAERVAQLEEVLRKMLKACGCLMEIENAEPMCCTCCKLAVRALGGKRIVLEGMKP
jgi:hypothetical protein